MAPSTPTMAPGWRRGGEPKLLQPWSLWSLCAPGLEISDGLHHGTYNCICYTISCMNKTINFLEIKCRRGSRYWWMCCGCISMCTREWWASMGSPASTSSYMMGVSIMRPFTSPSRSSGMKQATYWEESSQTGGPAARPPQGLHPPFARLARHETHNHYTSWPPMWSSGWTGFGGP